MRNLQKQKGLQKKWLCGVGLVTLLVIMWQLLSYFFVEEEKNLRTQVRESVKEKFPDHAEKFSKTIGLFHYDTEKTVKQAEGRGKTVVLIHGLDDPGKVWMNLAPALAAEGYDVWQMHYPNDQPIVESADLFTEELKKLRGKNIESIVIVGHSMGGLISRELLTSPSISYGNLSLGDNGVPKVDMLIMVGTPNHGSHMVRFRVLSEVRDHFDRMIKGKGNGLGFILDGAGEAKIDLLPGSKFLEELNARPHPEGVEYLVIAGVTTPWSEEDIAELIKEMRKETENDLGVEFQGLQNFLISMTHGIGDGLVTVESTSLPGVPHMTVNGTHLSMIRNIQKESERVPPAVPIIVKKLNQWQ